MYRLKNRIQHYQWGGGESIPALLGISNPSHEKYAELWIGGHRNGSSQLSIDGQFHSLYELVQAHPKKWLGAAMARRHGRHFPFLFKVLSVNDALSIQVHPNDTQAAEGHRQGRAGYNDPHHKPELICALTPFWAMCGFRPSDELTREFTLPHYRPLRARLDSVSHIEELFPLLLELAHQTQTKTELLQGCAEYIARHHPAVPLAIAHRATPPDGYSSQENAYWWVLKLMGQFPDDLGALAPLYLNVIALQPTEGLYIGPRTIHAYLHGDGIEIMASSDNVLRCGLTIKHIDDQELLRIVDLARADLAHADLAHAKYHRVEGRRTGRVTEYVTPADEFALHAIHSTDSPLTIAHAPMPKTFLCMEGEVEITVGEAGGKEASEAAGKEAKREPRITLTHGQSLFCMPEHRVVTVRGNGTLYMAMPSTKIQYADSPRHAGSPQSA